MLSVSPGTYALVTGASFGIGEAIAAKLAERGIPVLLAARSAGRLEEVAGRLRARHGVLAEAVPVDLAAEDGAASLFERTEGAGRPVDLLVNAAGFGLNGPFTELPLDRTLEMLRLNVVATTELSHRVLAAMRTRGRGRVLTVASTTAFVPGPYFAAYSASKAYLLSLTHALHEEAKRDGITVTALCPGYTRTRFHEVAGMRGAAKTPFPEMLADDVAEIGLLALERGKPFVVPHPLDRLWIGAGRLFPRWLPVRLAAELFSRTRLKTGS